MTLTLKKNVNYDIWHNLRAQWRLLLVLELFQVVIIILTKKKFSKKNWLAEAKFSDFVTQNEDFFSLTQTHWKYMDKYLNMNGNLYFDIGLGEAHVRANQTFLKVSYYLHVFWLFTCQMYVSSYWLLNVNAVYTDKNHRKIWKKRQKTFPNVLGMRFFFGQNGQIILTKIFSFWENLWHFSVFSHDFFTIFVSVCLPWLW